MNLSTAKNRIERHLPNRKKLQEILISFYIVGILGMIIPYTRTIFIYLIVPTLLFNISLILLYLETPNKIKAIVLMSFTVLFGYFIELIGVNTGIIFGSYEYGFSLGPKIAGTPPMIGINWLMLSLAIYIVLKNFRINRFLIAPIGATALTLYDFIMEPVAIKTQMWYWKDNQIPIQNYIAWWVISFIILLVYSLFKFDVKSKAAPIVLILQFIFFLILNGGFSILNL